MKSRKMEKLKLFFNLFHKKINFFQFYVPAQTGQFLTKKSPIWLFCQTGGFDMSEV